MCIVLDWFVTIISGLTEHIKSTDTISFNYRSDDGGGDDTHINNIILTINK